MALTYVFTGTFKPAELWATQQQYKESGHAGLYLYKLINERATAKQDT